MRDHATAALATVLARLPSAHSRRSYAADWGRFAEWLRRRRLAVVKVRPRDVEEYITRLQQTGKKRGTYSHALSVIRKVFGKLVRDEHMAANPAREIETPPSDMTPKTPWANEAMILALFALSAESWGDRRDRMVLCLLFGLGWRRAEVARIRVEDFHDGAVSVVVKGSKTITVGVPQWVESEIVNWRRHAGIAAGALLPRRPDLANAPHNHVYAGPCKTEDCNPAALSGDLVYAAVRRSVARAGLPKGSVTPHALRRSKITIEGIRGVSLKARQLAVGHESASTTERYDRAREAAQQAPGEVLADLVGNAVQRTGQIKQGETR